MTNSFYIKKDKTGSVIIQVGRSHIMQPAIKNDKNKKVMESQPISPRSAIEAMSEEVEVSSYE